MIIRQLSLYTFEKGGEENIFLEGENSFLFPLFQKCIKKLKCQQQKFGFWFLVLCIWFQYIQWIEHKPPLAAHFNPCIEFDFFLRNANF